MAYIPLFLRANPQEPILIIGGGEIAAAKTEALASVGATLEIRAIKVNTSLKELCDKHKFFWREEMYDTNLLEGKRIVIAATDNNELNIRIAADARARGILVNVVDNPELCDFIFPALIKRGPLQIAISSSGISPVLARMVKHRIEQIIPVQYERLIAYMDRKKSYLRSVFTKIQPRRIFCEELIRGPIAEQILEGNSIQADLLFDHAIQAFPNVRQAALYLIGAGPGNPELLTLKAARLISQADIILYDRLISPIILDQYARKDAEKISVGKTRNHHLKKQEDILVLIEKHLRKGDVVVRLKGGDPGIYAHGAEEIEIARKLECPYQIVPGVSAALGCAAYAGFPLTERDGAQGVRFLTLYTKSLHDDSYWESFKHTLSDTLVFYMSTPHFSLLCEKLIESGRVPNTPLVVIEQGTTPYHREYGATLETFHSLLGKREFNSPALMIIGDVVRWRKELGWKEAPQEDGIYFDTLPQQTNILLNEEVQLNKKEKINA